MRAKLVKHNCDCYTCMVLRSIALGLSIALLCIVIKGWLLILSGPS